MLSGAGSIGSGVAFASVALLSTAAIATRRYLSRRPPRPRREAVSVVFGKGAPGVSPVTPAESLMDPPVSVEDQYFWMRSDDRTDPASLAHVEAENEYTATMLSPLAPLKEEIYDEFIDRLQETSSQFPTRIGHEYAYYTRSVKGQSYALNCRVPLANISSAEECARSTSEETLVPTGEQILLDLNSIVSESGAGFADLGEMEPSPSHKVIAYSLDFDGDEVYDIYLKEIATGKLLEETPIAGTGGGIVFGASDSEYYYCTMDATKRPDKIWRHVVGQPQSADECLLTEDDERFYLRLRKSDDDRFLVAKAGSKLCSESWLLNLADEEPKFRSVQPRLPNLLYTIEPYHDSLFVVSNADDALNFKVSVAPLGTHDDVSAWRDIVPHSSTRKIDYVEVFSKFAVVGGRDGGFCQVWHFDPNAVGADADVKLAPIAAPEQVCVMTTSGNYNYETEVLRLRYSSPTVPWSVFEYAPLGEQKLKLLQRKHVPNYDPSKYKCVRSEAVAKDGRRIPISVVYRPDRHKLVDGDASCPLASPAPLLLYGYGSYGHSIEPTFSSTTISLLDRGMVYATAHIRGGGEMGRAWYEKEGKLLTKRNTFDDFICCANTLVETGWGAEGRLAMMGASAGGLLMGAVMNMAPTLFSAVVAKVPFVDVMNTMSDAKIPLTVTEYEEWGNPHAAEYYEYMRSYSPYDNVHAAAYPALLATAGLNDPRVAYWEPAKFVAKLRDHNTSDNPIMLKTDMGSGHFSASDRYKYLKEIAGEWAFLVDRLMHQQK